MANLDSVIASVKLEKAAKAFDSGVAVCGSVESHLRSLDCTSRGEAVAMLSKVQTVRIYKADGKVIVE